VGEASRSCRDCFEEDRQDAIQIETVDRLGWPRAGRASRPSAGISANRPHGSAISSARSGRNR